MAAADLATLLCVGTMYAAQGVTHSVILRGVMVQAAGALSIRSLALSQLVALPWALRPFYAPFFTLPRGTPVLEVLEHARAQATTLQLLAAAIFALVAFVVPAPSSPAFSAPALFVSCFTLLALSACQDLGTDTLGGLAVGADARGWTNALQVGGYRIGM